MGEIHPEIVAENAEIFGIICDESTANVWRAVFFDALEKLEQLRGLEMFKEVTAINPVALARDLAHLFTPQKLEDVDLEVFSAELFTGRDRFGVTFNAEPGDSVLLQRSQKKSAPRAEIQNFPATGEVRNLSPMKLQHLVVGRTELIRIESVSLEKIRFG